MRGVGDDAWHNCVQCPCDTVDEYNAMPWKETSGSGTGPGVGIDAGEKLIAASRITVGDCLSAASLGISIIDELTSQGLDYQGNPFAPYSTSRPYYWNPNRYYGDTSSSRKTRQAFSLHHARYYGGERKKGSETIRYDSYAAFHSAVAGTDAVTLSLLMHRIYDSMEGQAGGVALKGSDAGPGLDEYMDTAEEFSYGVYSADDETLMIATAHNEGVPQRGLPQREFMNVSEESESRMVDHISDRILRRLVNLGEDARGTG